MATILLNLRRAFEKGTLVLSDVLQLKTSRHVPTETLKYDLVDSPVHIR